MKQKSIKPDNTSALKAFDHLFSEIDTYVKAGGDTSRLGEAINKKYGHRLFYSEVSAALELACTLSTPDHELRRVDLTSSLMRANDNTLSELIHLCYYLREALSYLRSNRDDPKGKDEIVSSLNHYYGWLSGQVESEMLDRIQGYRIDIKHLKEKLEAANVGS